MAYHGFLVNMFSNFLVQKWCHFRCSCVFGPNAIPFILGFKHKVYSAHSSIPGLDLEIFCWRPVKSWLLLGGEPLQYSPLWAEPNVSTFAHCLKTAEQTCGVSKNQRQETHLFSALSGLPSGVSIVTQHETMYRKKTILKRFVAGFFRLYNKHGNMKDPL
jgi:hypothetical protein